MYIHPEIPQFSSSNGSTPHGASPKHLCIDGGERHIPPLPLLSLLHTHTKTNKHTERQREREIL